jgi:transposase InsO family protein
MPRRKPPVIADAVLDQLLAGREAKAAFDPSGLLDQLKKALAERALGTRAPMTLPQGANQRWSLDFVANTLTDGRRFRILVVVDDFTRECLCLACLMLFSSSAWPTANTKTSVPSPESAQNSGSSWCRHEYVRV